VCLPVEVGIDGVGGVAAAGASSRNVDGAVAERVAFAEPEGEAEREEEVVVAVAAGGPSRSWPLSVVVMR
jgi:hypothetical protein